MSGGLKLLAGELEHRDSAGTSSVIRAGDMQRMSAGSDVRHSDFNDSKTIHRRCSSAEGADAEVLEPPELRAAIADELRRAGAAYAG